MHYRMKNSHCRLFLSNWYERIFLSADPLFHRYEHRRNRAVLEEDSLAVAQSGTHRKRIVRHLNREQAHHEERLQKQLLEGLLAFDQFLCKKMDRAKGLQDPCFSQKQVLS